jgi:Schlafen, AlbA_2
LRLSWQIRLRIRFLLIAALLGLAAGVFVLLPLNEFVYFKEYGSPGYSTGIGFATAQVSSAIHGDRPKKTVVYGIAGTVLSLLAAGVFSSLADRQREIARLSSALEGDLQTLIAQGESANLELKSSFRWDLKENKVNRALEGVVLKTLAGYMNGNGGTLLIGVADDGSIVGLENDYQTLKKQDRDGFEQALMTAVATQLGGDACHSVQMMFQSIEQKDVCRVIAGPAHRPVYLRSGETPKLYVRTGVSTRELNVQEAVNYTEARWKR